MPRLNTGLCYGTPCIAVPTSGTALCYGTPCIAVSSSGTALCYGTPCIAVPTSGTALCLPPMSTNGTCISVCIAPYIGRLLWE